MNANLDYEVTSVEVEVREILKITSVLKFTQ